MKINISIIDDDGNSYQGEMKLVKDQLSKTKLITKTINQNKKIKKITIPDKILELISERFFDKNRTISDIVSELKTHDYHKKSSDLTSPLRVIVRNNMLKKTKNLPDGTTSRYWTYVRKNEN